MQPVLALHDYKDLYQLLLALLEASGKAKASADEAGDYPGVILWSQETHSELLDSPDKLIVVERHARKLNLRVILSAASDSELRSLGRDIGWTVMWDLPGLDTGLGENLSRGKQPQPTKDAGQGNS